MKISETLPRRLLRTVTSVVALQAVLVGSIAAQQPVDPYVGFTSARAQDQAMCEERFLRLPSSASFREHLRIITSAPHPAGSAAQVEVGNYLCLLYTSDAADE